MEVSYEQPVQIADVRGQLQQADLRDAVVQYFGTSRDVSIRLPVIEDGMLRGLLTSEDILNANSPTPASQPQDAAAS